MITQAMTKLEGHPITGLFERFRTMSPRVFSQSLRLIFGAYMLEANKHETWKQL